MRAQLVLPTAHGVQPSRPVCARASHRRVLRGIASSLSSSSSAQDSALVTNTACTRLGFGFSAGGLLFPYFLGVVDALQTADILRPETPVAGASAGSLIAACAKSGVPTETLLAALLDLASDCRQGGTRHRLRGALERVLLRALPDDIHLRCNDRCHIAVTRLWPEFRAETVSTFRSRRHLIDALLVSCHIPWYFDGSLFTMYRDSVYFDGGITNFIPATPTERCVRVSCFPSQQMRAFRGIGISPDTFEDWPHDLPTMLGWAFEPAPEEMLLKLVEKGRRDGSTWALKHGPDAANTPQQLVLGSGAAPGRSAPL